MENIRVFDLHTGMEAAKLQQYDVVYLCGGNTQYLLKRINDTKFNRSLMEYIDKGGLVIGVSRAGKIQDRQGGALRRLLRCIHK